jgi:hypothetical protein
MKLVRESISNFERGKDLKDALVLGKRAQIKKWFDDLDIDESYYEIKDDLSVIVKGWLNLRYTHMIELPDNLTIEGDLTIRHAQKLPKNLTIEGNLNLMNTELTELPDNLKHN